MKYFINIFFLLLFISCASTKVDESKYEEMLSLIRSNSYQIEILSVQPFNTGATSQVINDLLLGTGNNSSRIDVEGDRFFIKMNGKKASAILPYFGERRLAGNYNESGIQFDDNFYDYELQINERKQMVTLSYKITNNTENYHLKFIPIEVSMLV